LVFGTSDKDRHFHPLGICVSSNEAKEDFEFIFRTLKETSAQLVPKVLVADGAEAITNGFRNIFGNDFVRVYCYFHVKKQVKDKLRKIKDEPKKSEIMEDISARQLANTYRELKSASSLFVKKWAANNNAKAFITYFQKEYIENRSGWYECHAPGFPSTNNCLVSINSLLKKEGRKNAFPWEIFLVYISNHPELVDRQRPRFAKF